MSLLWRMENISPGSSVATAPKLRAYCELGEKCEDLKEE